MTAVNLSTNQKLELKNHTVKPLLSQPLTNNLEIRVDECMSWSW